MMRPPQAPTTPQAPQAPAAPPAPTTAPAGTPSSDQVREQVRKAIEDAKAQAKQARIDAQKARQDAAKGKPSELPAPFVIDGLQTGTLQPSWPEVQQMVQNISAYFLTAVCVIAIGIPLVRALGRRLGPAPVAPPLPREVSDQLKRIEQAVESMAIEIERVSEAQRFLTKLSTGKAESGALPPRSGA